MELIGKIEDRLIHADWKSLEAFGYEDEYDSIPMYGYNVHSGYSKGFTHDTYWDLYDLCQTEPRKVARFLDEAGITEDDILFSEVNEVNGNNHDSFGTTTDIQPYVSSRDRPNIVVDAYGRYIFK
jgi:hypothetical protein